MIGAWEKKNVAVIPTVSPTILCASLKKNLDQMNLQGATPTLYLY